MDDDRTLSDLLLEYDSAKDVNSLSLSWVRNLLKEMRKSKISRFDIVLKWGSRLLSGESNIDVWNLHEQIAVAAIDMGEHFLAVETITKLKKKFGDSNRVNRLQGMLLEAQGQYADAVAVYDEILKKDIANVAARKRKVCILKAQGDVQSQVDEINQLLRFFPADAGSWAELGEIYLSMCDYQAAVHCYEELVLLDSRNAHYHCRLGESLYSIGGQSVLTARKHFTISLNFQCAKINLRALYGLIACCKSIRAEKAKTAAKKGAVDHESQVNDELLAFAKGKLEEISQTTQNGALALMESCLF